MKRNVFGIDFDPIDQRALIVEVLERARIGIPGYVVTANLHLAVQLRRDAEVEPVLADPTALVVPDGRPLLWMARLRGFRMHLVTGSDLVIPLCRAAANEQLSVFLFGTTFQTLTECARRLVASIDRLRITGVYSPPFGFERDLKECALAARIIQAAAPDIVFVALGQPKQEIWARRYVVELKAQAVCVGAGLDFIAGTQRRAPSIVRRGGFEWLWRMLTQPRRLGVRYLTILCWLPYLVGKELVAEVRPRAS
jgi:exopolysaccharide biosynthesis WecB/TagA/CpsF family protein